MGLSPEEKKRIYEEEKARLEAREQLARERQKTTQQTITDLKPNVAGLLCYLGGWITGIIIFILERKNSWVRFHAAQSIVVFGLITVAGIVFGFIPTVGNILSSIVYLVGFVLWVLLMVKAYGGEMYKLGFLGDIAESIVTSLGVAGDSQQQTAAETMAESSGGTEEDLGKQIEQKVEDYFRNKRAGRVAASAFAIAWSAVAFVFFNFFNEYVAYYHKEMVSGVQTWVRQPFFTGEISLWLPVLNTALMIAVVGHIVLIIFDRYVLREVIQLVIDAFGLAVIISLVSIFPFDFNVLPSPAIAGTVHVSVTIFLIVVAVLAGIGILVRLIKLIANIIKGTASYGDGA